jgi:hypothetical protein
MTETLNSRLVDVLVEAARNRDETATNVLNGIDRWLKQHGHYHLSSQWRAEVRRAVTKEPASAPAVDREGVREAEIADLAYARLEGHFRSLAHIASYTLECNADDVRKLEDSAESVARYRKEQRDVHC